MPGKSIRIGRIAGIPFGIHPLWLLIVALITWALGDGYYPAVVEGIAPGAAYALGLLSALLLFASIVLHELGHAIVARRHGVEIEEIDLWLLGGVARMKGEPREARDELRFALAGPAVTLVITAVFALAALALAGRGPDALRAVVEYQAIVNATILVFNLLPAFPLDGGRVARALLWMRLGDVALATRVAARGGTVFGWGFVALGTFALLAGEAGGAWLALIGLFIVAAARGEAMHVEVHAVFEGRQAADLMACPAVTIPAELTVAEAVRRFFAPYRFTAFPVTDAEGLVVGLFSISGVQAVPVGRRETVRVGEVADRDPALVVSPSDDVADLLERPAFARTGRAIVVAGPGEALGILSISDVQRVVRALRLAQGHDGRPGRPA